MYRGCLPTARKYLKKVSEGNSLVVFQFAPLLLYFSKVGYIPELVWLHFVSMLLSDTYIMKPNLKPNHYGLNTCCQQHLKAPDVRRNRILRKDEMLLNKLTHEAGGEQRKQKQMTAMLYISLETEKKDLFLTVSSPPSWPENTAWP